MVSVLITGTSKGIGYDSALVLARAGYDVVATMRNPDASDLAEISERESLAMKVVALDVNDAGSVKSVFDEYADSIDVLVNNAGILSLDAIEDESMDNFEAVMQTNYLGAVRCCKAVLPTMRTKGAGCIINVTSIAGKIPTFSEAAYSASKAALESFSEVLAQETVSFGLRVYILEPGIISTPMATTELPAPKSSSVYSAGRRMAALFENAATMPAPASIVADKIQYLIESNDRVLRHPVGPDALPFLGWRLTSSEEEFRDNVGVSSDAEFKIRLLRNTMIDLDPFL
jgi:NAD(P)-dependent dehydrogenase (short-subunit alcohol dehydrogenase family)